ncbi:MAG TPA: STAS domain-containing protein [Steroidobacteraceae bacterium]|nr:STAS domain-containing protein [Steroidobacteraceae bacterium]
MPFEIRAEGNYLVTRLSGVLDLRGLGALVAEMERLEGLPAGPQDRITDLTELERIDVGFEEVFAVANRRAQRAVAKPIRSALIAVQPVHYGFARMFQMLNDNPRIQIRIFASRAEAVEWLAGDKR